jgi:hypothetical protein
MTIGDCYILTSNFTKQDIGMLLIGENKQQYYFTPILFQDNKFGNSEGELFDSSILTNTVFHGLNGDTVTGIFAIHEYKKKPSFLTTYCQDNKPYINLNLNIEKFALETNTEDLTKIIVGSGTNMPPTKEMFDKFHIQSLLHVGHLIKLDLNTILKSK